MNVPGRHNVGNLLDGAEGKEANVGEAFGGLLEAQAVGAFSDEYKAEAGSLEEPGGVEKRIPRAVEAEIAGVDGDSVEAAANFLRDGVRGVGEDVGQVRAVADDFDAIRGDAFFQDAIAHVVAEDDDARGLAQGAAMHPLPKARDEAGANDVAADGHVGVEVADVVNERTARQRGHERAGDARDGRIGHGDDDVGSRE